MRRPTLCGNNRVNTPDDHCDECRQFEERLEQLEECCDEMRTWQTVINTWKNTIDTWKSTIDTWKDGIDAWKDEVASDFNIFNLWKNTINTWKDAIDTWKENIDQNGYNALSNKPKINGITVEGNKSSEDYLIRAISTIDVDALTLIECYEPPCADSRVCYGETCCMKVGCDE